MKINNRFIEIFGNVSQPDTVVCVTEKYIKLFYSSCSYPVFLRLLCPCHFVSYSCPVSIPILNRGHVKVSSFELLLGN